MQEKRCWFPVRPARNGWGWGFPLVWLVLLIGGSIVLAPHGVGGLIANGFVSGGFLLAVVFWKGEPQRMRDSSSP